MDISLITSYDPVGKAHLPPHPQPMLRNFQSGSSLCWIQNMRNEFCALLAQLQVFPDDSVCTLNRCLDLLRHIAHCDGSVCSNQVPGLSNMSCSSCTSRTSRSDGVCDPVVWVEPECSNPSSCCSLRESMSTKRLLYHPSDVWSGFTQRHCELDSDPLLDFVSQFALYVHFPIGRIMQFFPHCEFDTCRTNTSKL